MASVIRRVLRRIAHPFAVAFSRIVGALTQARSGIVELAGFACLTVAGWDVARPLGLAVAGFACLLTGLALASPGGRR